MLLGLDWIVIDTEHGPLDFKEVLEHIRVTRGTATTPIVRVPELSQGTIKRVLDLGAQGVIVPQVTTVAEVERAVSYAKYPPTGVRGVGGERATQRGLGLAEQTRIANEETQVIPLIESVAGGDALDAIAAVPGVAAVFFGPADYSASAGHLAPGKGQASPTAARPPGHPPGRGIPAGVMATDLANAELRNAQGFQMIGIGSDTGLLIRSAREALQKLRTDLS